MNYNDMMDWKKQIEFNSTYHETLIKLIGDAQKKGAKAQQEIEILRKKSTEITKILQNECFLRDNSILDNIELKDDPTVGIDGSFQLVGGIGGKWYVPISVSRIVYPKKVDSNPEIDIFWAKIKEIQEQKDFKPASKAAILMLIGETKAILNWGAKGIPSLVYIDGPIVDPPSYSQKDYVENRSIAIKKTLEKSLMIGCVKRSRERFYIDQLAEEENKKNVEKFPSDQHLMAFIFANLRYNGYYGPCFTKWIDISNATNTYQNYRDKGVHVVCTFFQKSANSQVLRLDIPIINPIENNRDLIDKIVNYGCAATNYWIYPGHDYPIPVMLAHDKCNIREGCAEVLYEEILTRTKTVHPISQAISEQLR